MTFSGDYILTDRIRRLVTEQSRFYNRLIREALSRKLGEPVNNPYRYLKRMSKMENASGMTVYLDGAAILWVGPASTGDAERISPSEDYRIVIETPYRFLGDAQVSL